jgi:hypothetical protein
MAPDDVLKWMAIGFGGVAAFGMALVLGLFAFARYLERRESGGSTKHESGSPTGDLGTNPGGPTSDGPGSRVAMTGLAT